jgi:hypothetical protein
LHKEKLLSNIVDFEKTNEGKQISNAELKRIQFIEKHAIRVVDTENERVFYIAKIDGKWYIVAVDRVSTDCSA